MLSYPLTIRKIIIYILSVAVLIPSIFFINLMPTTTFDEGYHLVDINRYINQGINFETLYAHTTPTGPGTHLWATLFGKLLGNSLPIFRFSIWICWVGICLLYYGLYQQERKDKILFSFVFLFSNPYTCCLSGLIMTEPFALMGVLSGIYCLKKLSTNHNDYFFLILGGLCMGFAIISRLYYICIIPSLALSMLYSHRKNMYQWSFLLKTGIQLLLTVTPLTILYYIWGSLTPPLFNKGDFFPNSKIYFGINLLRPLSAILYIGIYCFPFILIFYPGLLNKKWKFWIPAVAISFFITQNLYIWRLERVHIGTGLIDALVTFSYKINYFIGSFAYFVSVLLAIMGALILCNKSWILLRKELAIIDIFFHLIVLFFVIQQTFISGQTPFYDRYLIQIAPFLALIIYNDKIKFNWKLLCLVLVYLTIGQFILWRFYKPI